MLREARIVMPITRTRSDAHESLRRSLVNAFGGYTSFTGEGGWSDDGTTKLDAVAIYDVAIDDTQANRKTLLDIALEAGRQLDQKAVYIRYPDGCVDIVDVKPAMANLVDYGEGTMPYPAGDIGMAEMPSETDKLYKELTGVTFGTRRLPQVGEVWRNRGGALVAVMAPASVLDGGYTVVTLSKSDVARAPGHVYVVNLDGNVHRDTSPVPGDLVTLVTRFDC